MKLSQIFTSDSASVERAADSANKALQTMTDLRAQVSGFSSEAYEQKVFDRVKEKSGTFAALANSTKRAVYRTQQANAAKEKK